MTLRMRKLAILNNIAPPYRMPIYRSLANQFDTELILSGVEDNRSWEPEASSDRLPIRYAWGRTIKRKVATTDGQDFDTRYFHINPGYLWELFRFSPNAVISTEMGFRSLMALLYCLLMRRKLWVWWGGTIHTEAKNSRIKGWVRRFIFVPFVPRWISYGETSTEYLMSIGVHEENILQIQNAVDSELYASRGAMMQLDAPHPRLLVVGQLIGRKGVDQLLDAILAAGDALPEMSLVLVGDGSERRRLLEKAAGVARLTTVHYPYLPPEEMGSIYRAGDILVFPTLEDVWGLVVNEAILSGIPVLVSKWAGCAQELVPSAQIFDPLDTNDFARVLVSAVTEGIQKTDPGVLVPIEVVAQIIGDDIESRL